MTRLNKNTFQPGLSRGFTLIELLVVVAILGVLLALGVPSFQTWIANTRIRTTAEALQNGLMLAKAEAIRRNAKVQFALTTTEPVIGNVNAITASSTGTNWVVRRYQSGGSYAASDFIQGRSVSDGGQNTMTNSGSAPGGCIQQSTVVFTGIGGLSPIPASTICYEVNATGGNRPLRVTVTPGGAVRMCDPGLSINTSTMGC